MSKTNDNKPNDDVKGHAIDHVLIRDKTTGKIILNKRG